MTTAAPTTTVNPDRPLPTKREWLAKQGLAVSIEDQKAAGKRGGGRLSKAAHDAIAKQLLDPRGQRFSD